jgi:hypothetical protein
VGRWNDEDARFPSTLCVHETASAIRVRLEDGRAQWIPKSVVSEDSEVWKHGDEGELVIAGWFALKEGLI